jgi:hypothetical protein
MANVITNYEPPVLFEVGEFYTITCGPSGACIDGFGGYQP